MLAHAEERDADPIGEYRLLDNVAEDLRLVKRLAVRAKRDVAERVQTELDRRRCRGVAHFASVLAARQRTSA
jgi:hypothetical protein